MAISSVNNASLIKTSEIRFLSGKKLSYFGEQYKDPILPNVPSGILTNTPKESLPSKNTPSLITISTTPKAVTDIYVPAVPNKQTVTNPMTNNKATSVVSTDLNTNNQSYSNITYSNISGVSKVSAINNPIYKNEPLQILKNANDGLTKILDNLLQINNLISEFDGSDPSYDKNQTFIKIKQLLSENDNTVSNTKYFKDVLLNGTFKTRSFIVKNSPETSITLNLSFDNSTYSFGLNKLTKDNFLYPSAVSKIEIASEKVLEQIDNISNLRNQIEKA